MWMFLWIDSIISMSGWYEREVCLDVAVLKAQADVGNEAKTKWHQFKL